ncbi:hypothetical protein [Peribacillus butanolivorans]|uniref:hypothetical protein n=1 Tax=Peribacillus butanolivorans TaxID=421767 RepID=UPI0035D68208
MHKRVEDIPMSVPKLTVVKQIVKKRKRGNALVIAGFLAPALLFYGVYVVYSIAMTFYYSLFEWSGIDNNFNFIGIGNYVQLLGDVVF